MINLKIIKMKKIVLSLAVFTLVFTSCTSSDDETTPVVSPPLGSGELTGDVSASKNLIKGNYTLEGVLKVKPGVTLTIDAGSVITANTASGSSFDAILVEKGGKIVMNGTAAEPIVCTHATKVAGSWGGIIIYGDAPIVGAAGVVTANSEDGISSASGSTPVPYTYGGGNSFDNSGSLKYVRVEYAGKKIADGSSELNGFSFYAVGSGTVLENLVSYKGNDDGFEFYGGTVSAKNLISYGNADDSFDWQDGWRGQENTNWYAYQTGVGNYGMEIESKNVDNAFWPVVSGITLKRAAGTVTEDNTPQYDAIQFKSRGNGFYSNILISGYTNPSATAVRIQDAGTNTSQVNASKIKITNVQINDGTNPFAAKDATFTVAFPEGFFVTSTTATGASITPGAWAVVDGVNLLSNL
jgi:hypothetical protein